MLLVKNKNQRALTNLYKEISVLSFVSVVNLCLGYIYQVTFMALFVLSGFLAFTLLEYIAHRYIFHLRSKNKKLTIMAYNIHGVHHKFPADLSKYYTPVYGKALVAVIISILFYSLLGNMAFGISAGFLPGYAMYLTVHCFVHYYYPPNNVLHILWEMHEIHHHINVKVAYGVSCPVWDFIFLTLPSKTDFKKYKIANLSK